MGRLRAHLYQEAWDATEAAEAADGGAAGAGGAGLAGVAGLDRVRRCYVQAERGLGSNHCL